MGITIEKIDENEHFEYKGDVKITGNIGKNATVIIKDGNLTVDGDVEDGSAINLTQESNNTSFVVSSGSFFMNNVSIGNINMGKSLVVNGSVRDNVTFNSHNADFSVNTIGKQCTFKTHNGEISTSHIGENTHLETHNGNISSGNVGKNSSIKSHNGEVDAKEMGENTSAITHNGNVRVAYAPKSAHLETHNGSVYENGVKRRKEKPYYQSSFSMVGNNITVVGGGRIIVNGRDVSDLTNNNANSNSKDEPPIRYKKS